MLAFEVECLPGSSQTRRSRVRRPQAAIRMMRSMIGVIEALLRSCVSQTTEQCPKAAGHGNRLRPPPRHGYVLDSLADIHNVYAMTLSSTRRAGSGAGRGHSAGAGKKRRRERTGAAELAYARSGALGRPQVGRRAHLNQGSLLLSRNALAEVCGGDAELPP